MITRMIGDRTVSPIGLGCAGLSLAGPPRPEAVATIHAALDGGVRVIDTAAAYVPNVASVSHNEHLVADALRMWSGDRGEVVVVAKGGHKRIGDDMSASSFEICGRPGYLRTQAQESVTALGTDAIDLYLLHWPDPDVPIAESMGALDQLRRDGIVRHVGLSNVTLDQLEEAAAVGPVAAVENRFSALSRREQPVLDWCAQHGVTFLAYSPLGGIGRAAGLADRAPAFASVADAHGVSPQQVALAWAVGHSPVLIPIPGCRRPSSAADCAAAISLELSDAEQQMLAG